MFSPFFVPFVHGFLMVTTSQILGRHGDLPQEAMHYFQLAGRSSHAIRLAQEPASWGNGL